MWWDKVVECAKETLKLSKESLYFQKNTFEAVDQILIELKQIRINMIQEKRK